MNTSVLRLPMVFFLVTAMGLQAANVTWDGDGAANTSGPWGTGVNWSTNAVPTVTDNAQLLDVTAGTRTVEISSGSPTTINKLTITQTTAGAFNVLNVNDDLTIGGNSTPFAITATAGQDSIVTNIAAGKTLLATNTGSMTMAFGGTLNLGAGSLFKVRATGTTSDLTSPTFGGPINATGAGAQVVLQPDRFVSGTGGATFAGAVAVSGAGSSLDIRRLTSTDTVGSMAATFSGNDGAGNSIKLAAGTQLNLAIVGGTLAFTNRVTLDAAAGANAGAIMAIGASTGGSSTTTLNYNGGLALGAGAKQTVVDQSILFTLGGLSSLAAGSELLLQYPNAQGNALLTNGGTFTMNSAAIKIDWTASGSNNPGASGRKFVNTGTWTLKNNSSIAFISSNGRPTSGFGVGAGNNNSGTLNIESGSSMGFADLSNTGALNLGSSTSGASDATVNVGSPLNTFGAVSLINGLTSAGVAGIGTININGNTYLGRTTPSNITTLANGTNVAGTITSTGSVINIGNGSAPVLFTVANTNTSVLNAAGNSITINDGGTLLLKSVLTTNSTGYATLTNNGTLTQKGTLQLQGAFNGARSITTGATGIYRIQGAGAVIESLAQLNTGDPGNVAAVSFAVNNGILSGASYYDKITYTNSTGNSSFNTLALSVTGGEITPGAGTNGSGVSSIGTLEFANTNITLSGATKLSFDIGGASSADRILLSASRTFALGTGATLDIWLTNDFYTTGTQTFTLMDTGMGGQGTVTGSFAALFFQGQAVTDQYTIQYGTGLVSITLAAGLGTPIPEPSSAAVLAGFGVIGFALLRRRRTG